jgi:hypothetical protein
MKLWISSRQTGLFWSLLACTAACGGNDDAANRAAAAAESAAASAQSAAQAAQAAAQAAQAAAGLSPTRTTPSTASPGSTSGSMAPVAVVAPGGTSAVTTPVAPVASPDDGSGSTSGAVQAAASTSSGCTAPPGTNPAPTSIIDTINLINALPKPTSLDCFLESLSRPIALYATSSTQSLQPAEGAGNARTFVLRGPLELAVVLDGSASNTLELGFRSTPTRTIKTEILFPVTLDLSPDTLFNRVMVGPTSTECAACHTNEKKVDLTGFTNGAWESDVNDPYDVFNVTVDTLQSENANCDSATYPTRCTMLGALLNHGPVQAGQLGNPGLQ